MRKWYRMFRSQVIQRVIPRSRRLYADGQPIDVVGYFSTSAGVGESARLCVDALHADQRPCRITDVSLAHENKADLGWVPPALSSAPATTRILHLNPPMLPRAIWTIGPRKLLQTFNIGYWAWELDEIPAEWKNAFRYMNAIFVPSEFTRGSLAPHTQIPVIVVPHPVTEKPADPDIRARFGIAADAFLVSSVFSAGSSISRKNPDAVIRAFRIFASGHPNTFLLMKASGNVARDSRLRALVEDASRSGNIRVITDNLPASQIQGIIKASDAYISLHRSEGFGLTVAEAILHGTPVVSTSFSGTVDFSDPDNCWNTSYDLIPVEDEHPEFAGLKNARWADADPVHAAAQLAEIAADPVTAAARTRAARDYLVRYLAAHTYGHALRQLGAMKKPETGGSQR